MSFLKHKPFAVIGFLLSVALLTLACITTRNACYFQQGIYGYSKVDDWNLCTQQCGDRRAMKVASILSAASPPTAFWDTTPNSHQDYNSATPGVRYILRCSWKGTTNRLFLAYSSLLVVWFIIELILSARSRFPIFLNLIILLTIGLGIATAVYQMTDLHYTDCQDFADLSPFFTVCYSTLYNISFIFTIITLLCLLLQFLLNLKNRKSLNEGKPEKAKYDNVPQNSHPTEPAQRPSAEA